MEIINSWLSEIAFTQGRWKMSFGEITLPNLAWSKTRGSETDCWRTIKAIKRTERRKKSGFLFQPRAMNLKSQTWKWSAAYDLSCITTSEGETDHRPRPGELSAFRLTSLAALGQQSCGGGVAALVWHEPVSPRLSLPGCVRLLYFMAGCDSTAGDKDGQDGQKGKGGGLSGSVIWGSPASLCQGFPQSSGRCQLDACPGTFTGCQQ